MADHDPYCRWPGVPCACADFAAARAEARADERERNALDEFKRAWTARADLRDKVLALPTSSSTGVAEVTRDDVLALLDGEQR